MNIILQLLYLISPLVLSQVSDDMIDRAWQSLEKTPLALFALQQPLVNDLLQQPNWEFGRDAYIDVNKLVRLTADKQSQDGYLWARQRIGVDSWAIEFSFKITHEGALSGDGFAFWATKDPKISGPVFGNQDYFTGLGIFFDTYSNSRVRHSYPWVMAMNGDGKTHYDHEFDGNANEIGGCQQEIRNQPDIALARITYDNGYLKLDLKTTGPVWISCFQVPIKISPEYYFGFTAMTGGVTSKHDIYSIAAYTVGPSSGSSRNGDTNANTNTNNQGNNAAKNREPYHPPDLNIGNTYNNQQYRAPIVPPNNSWGFFTWFIVLSILGFLGYVGYVYVKTKEKASYKRF